MEKQHNDTQKMTRTSEDTLLIRRAARRQHQKGATIATLMVSAVFYFLLILRPEPQPGEWESGRNLSKEGSHTHFLRSTLNHDFSSYSCEDMHKLTVDHGPLTKSAQCDFAKTCNEGDGIFAPIVYCHPTLSSRTLMLLLSPPLVLFLLVLFRVLGSTAEEFFSPGLEMFSLKLGLPERFAGVTLLALGNGAPDVASTVNAILDDRKRGYLMALGELTGAAMVASTVIAAAVTYVSGGVMCRGPLVRDVVVFMLTMAVTYKSFEDGTITVTEIRCFIGLYAGYVLVVLGSDIYHRSVVVPRLTRRKRKQGEKQEKDGSDATVEGSLDIEMEAGETTALSAASADGKAWNGAIDEEGVTPIAIPDGGIERGLKKYIRADQKPMKSIERVIEAISNYDVDSNENSSEDENSSEEEEEGVESNLTEDHTKQLDTSKPQTVHRTVSSGWGERDEYGSEPLMVFHPHHGGMVNLKRSPSCDQHDPQKPSSPTSTFDTEYHECIDGELGQAPESWKDAFVVGRDEIVGHFCKLWNETYGSDDYNIVEKFLITCEMPFTLLRMLSIPVPCDGYYCRPLVALSICLSPLWMWYYCWNQFGVGLLNRSTGSVLLVLVLPLIVGLSVLRYAPCGEVPMRLSVAVPITVIGFTVSAAWLDLIADKLVSLLSFFGIILHIPSTIMGISILAWGNSSQDLIANMTVAKKGLSAMAITASFAGPVFNILVGLGIGLTILSRTGEPGQPITVELNNPLRVGFFFAVLNGLLVIISGVCIGKGTIPKNYGYVAMALYIVYAVASLTL